MPKLIPDVEKKLIDSARHILMTEGPDALSMRRVAGECGIAVGTLYNYFESKDLLIAKITVADWQDELQKMNELADSATDFTAGFSSLYTLLSDFVGAHRPSWIGTGQTSSYQSFSNSYRSMLVDQICGFITKLMQSTRSDNLLPLAKLLAETMLSTAARGDEYKESMYILAETLRKEV